MNHDLDASALLPAAVVSDPKEMLSVTEVDGVTKVRINFSSLAILQKCAREAQYSLIRGLKPQLESPALLFGTAIHKGLETYYCGERTERKIPHDYAEIMQMIGCGQWNPAWAESLLFRAARAFVEKATPLAQLSDDNKRSVFTGVWMLQHYFQKYLTDEYVIMRDEKGPVVERKFSLPLGSFEREPQHFVEYSSGIRTEGTEPGTKVEVELFGTIDFVMRSEVTGQILPGDHKTASSLYDFYPKIKPNFQYICYTLAAREILGYDTDSFMVNALQVKQPPKTNRGSEPDFARQITTCTEEDFAELKDAIIDSVSRFLRYRETGKFPMSASGSCTAFYGSCRFIDVCAAPASLRETIIKAKFVEKSYAQSN